MDEIDAPSVSDTHVNGTGPGTAPSEMTDPGALKPGFLAGLATAMRKAATRERERISTVLSGDAAAHIEKVRSRASIETEELRRLAEEDVQHINDWSASEIERIKTEAATKIEERRSSLDAYLKQHDEIIETEIQGVHDAVSQYGETLDRFFAELAATTDPSEIARRAERLPQPPDLDEVRSAARARAMARMTETDDSGSVAAPEMTATSEPEAVAEASADAPEAPHATAEVTATADDAGGSDAGAMVGVMDHGSASSEPTESSESPVEAEPVVAEAAPEPVTAETEPVTAEAAAEPEPVAAEAETPQVAEETPATPVGAPEQAPAPAPVGVMDPDAQRVPAWPAPAPAEPARISPTIDHTSAAVRLLRSVAPWTAPTHAASRSEGDAD